MKYKNYILILLFEILFGVTFNIIGTISISELFLLFYSFILLSKNSFKNHQIFKYITKLYIGLLISQLVSEIVIGNTLENALKGIMITVISYLHFSFLFDKFSKNRKYILYALAGILFRYLIFGTKFEGTIEGAISGEDSTFFKFYVVKIITIPLLIISALTLRKRAIAVIIIGIGVLFIILGARSDGLMFALTGIIAYCILSTRRIRKKQFISILVIISVLGYGLFIIYVNNVLSGKITAGNNHQLERVKDPYNPINLLLTGRTEVLVGYYAFMDKPLFGHGMWAKDNTGKYRNILVVIGDKNDSVDIGLVIPSHSILIGSGMYNGIFAFLFMSAILLLFIKTGFKDIDKRDPYSIIIIYSIIFILWNGLFSPTGHFKNTLPLYFAIIMISYIINKNHSIKKHQINHSVY